MACLVIEVNWVLISIVRGIDEVIRGSREWFNHYKNTSIRKYRNNIDLQLIDTCMVSIQLHFWRQTNKTPWDDSYSSIISIQLSVVWSLLSHQASKINMLLIIQLFIPCWNGNQNWTDSSYHINKEPDIICFGVYVFLLLPKVAAISQYHCLVMIMVTNHHAFLLYIVIDSLW